MNNIYKNLDNIHLSHLRAKASETFVNGNGNYDSDVYFKLASH